MLLGRLAFLLLTSTFMASACLGSDAPTSNPLPVVRIITPTATPLPTIEPPPEPPPVLPSPAIELVDNFAVQGGLVLVRLVNSPPAGKASVHFAGSTYPMIAEGNRWFTVVGLPADFAPGDYGIEVIADGQAIAQGNLQVGPSDFPRESIQLPPETAGLLTNAAAIEAERRLLASLYAEFTPRRLWRGPWFLPAEGPITDPFGLLRSINGGPFSPHSGTDIAAEAGLAVVAAAPGRVAFAGALYLRGNSVIIDHGAGVFSGYHHLSEINVTEDQEVPQGEQIGQVGETGLAGGPHLHWEAIVQGVRIDPLWWTYGLIEP